MSCSTCDFDFHGLPQPRTRTPVLWIFVWLVWGSAGAGTLLAIDQDWIGATAWFLIGLGMGIKGLGIAGILMRSLREHVRLIWEQPDPTPPLADAKTIREGSVEENHSVISEGVLILPALAGLAEGVLLGPFLGLFVIWYEGQPGWMRAIAGGIISSAVISVLFSVLAATAPRTIVAANQRPPRWRHLLSPLLLVPACWNSARTLVSLPRQRRVLQHFRERGAATWDLGSPLYLSVFFQGREFTDDDLKQLRSVTDLNLAEISGNDITDAGVVHLIGLRNLEILSLASPGITDQSVDSLRQLSRLTCLCLYGTSMTEDAIARLRHKLPRCQILA